MNKLLAPNGKPSNLTPEQYKLVRSYAFKKWFGDWENDPENASKVVDENGEPLVVYRGFNKKSDKGNVFKFGVNRFKNNRLANRFGHYFTNSKEVAKEYSEQGDKINDEDIIIKAYFLNIKNSLNITETNPKFPSFEEWKKNRIRGMQYSNYELIERLKLREFPTYSYLFSGLKVKDEDDIDELSEALISKLKVKIKEDESRNKEIYETYEYISLNNLIKLISNKKIDVDDVLSEYEYNQEEAETNMEVYYWFINHKKNEKYVTDDLDIILKDLIIKNDFDGGVYREWQFGVIRGKTDLVYFTFESNQIKLADGTNTTFDGSNPDIRFDGGGAIKKVNVVDIKQYTMGGVNYRFVEIAEKKYNKIEVYRQYEDDGKYWGTILYRKVPRYDFKFSSPMINNLNQLFAYSFRNSDEELFDAVKYKKKPFGSLSHWIKYSSEDEIHEKFKVFIAQCSEYNLEYSIINDKKSIIFQFCQKGTFDELFNIDDLIEDYKNNGFEDVELEGIKNFRYYDLSYFLNNEWDANGVFQYPLTGLILGIPPKFTMSILNMWTTYDLSKEYKYSENVTEEKYSVGGEIKTINILSDIWEWFGIKF